MHKYTIATFGSHSALQILKGAQEEGFKTLCICIKGTEKPYKSFGVADEIIIIDSWNDYFSIEEELIKKNVIIIPHASMIAYMGIDKINKMKTMYFGDKGVLEVEAHRDKQAAWLNNAQLNTPKTYMPATIDKLSIIKFHGADGGRGYFLAKDKEEFETKIAEHYQRSNPSTSSQSSRKASTGTAGRSGEKNTQSVRGEHVESIRTEQDFVIQEYVVGIPTYIHYFYSPLTEEIELLGLDKRYESNVDGIGRIAFKDQAGFELNTSYTVAGNKPLVLRESLLPTVFEMGEAVVKESQKLTQQGLYGAFCLETVITPDLKFYVFEISARIVAGTNVYMNGSPYTYLKYNEPMSTGRRIAREIKQAILTEQLHKVLG